MNDPVKYPKKTFQVNQDDIDLLNRLQALTGLEQTAITKFGWRLVDNFLKLNQPIINEIEKFARAYADKPGELTPEEVGYARAMLLSARSLPYDFDDETEALLDHIEANRL